MEYNNNRIIAIGDIHGDLEIFIELLKLAKVIDSKLNWIGKSTYIVQVGDTLDGVRPGIKYDNNYLNTPYELKIMKFILKLDSQAKKDSGRVISILGNHELYPYYFYKDKTFQKEYVKKADYKEYKKKYKISRDDFYYPGKGIGAKIFGRTRPLILQLGQCIFCHGSLNKTFLDMYTKDGKFNINEVNKQTRDWFTGKRLKPPKYINESDEVNPLFNRDLTDPDMMTNKNCDKLVNPLFKYFTNAKCIIMGHSTHKSISPLCNNKLYRIDIAISRAFGGTVKEKMNRLQVLEIYQTKNTIKTNILTKDSKIKIN